MATARDLIVQAESKVNSAQIILTSAVGNLDAALALLPPDPPPSTLWAWDATKGTVSVKQPNLAYLPKQGTYLAVGPAHFQAPAGTPLVPVKITGQGVPPLATPVTAVVKGGCTNDRSLTVLGADGVAYDFGLYNAGSTPSADGGAPVPVGAYSETPPGSGNAARFPLNVAFTPAEMKAAIAAGAGSLPRALHFTAPNVGPTPCPYPANTMFGLPGTGVTFGQWLALAPSSFFNSSWADWVKVIHRTLVAKGMFLRDVNPSAFNIICTDQTNQGGNAADWPAAGITLTLKTSAGVPYATPFPNDFPWNALRALDPPAR